jgi:branched-chain amino acid transport system ATP-binding protein
VLSSLSSHKVCHHGIARTFQITQPFNSLTVIENALIGALSKHHDMEKAREVSLAALARVGLHHKSDHPAASLTLQDRKMLEFARALATEPIVILLDEVMAGLDPQDQARVAEKIMSIRDSGITILLIEHVMRAVMGLSDRIIVLDHGMVIAEGTPHEVAKHPEVIRVYLGKSVETFAN